MTQKVIFFFACIFFTMSILNTNAMVPQLFTSCMQELNNQNIENLILTSNFYHNGDGVLPIEKENPSYVNTTGIRNAYISAWGYKCSKFTAIYTSVNISRIIPMYSIKYPSPIGFQVIYTQDTKVLESIMITNGNKISPPGFAYTLHLSDGDIYDMSLTEPFVSAPMLQMYNYLGHPLLVARSGTGVVTDVYFQNRPNIENPMERARKFLGKKWYTP